MTNLIYLFMSHSEQEFADIFEPTYKLLPGISRTKIYTFFHEKMKKGNISKQMNIDELNLIFTKKTTLSESCHPFENSVAWYVLFTFFYLTFELQKRYVV